MNVSTWLSLLMIVATSPISAQYLTPAQQLMVTNGAQGREFLIAIPPNEIGTYPTEGLEIYLSSAYDTEVTVTDYQGDRTYKRTLKAGEIRTLSDKRGETNWTWELKDTSEVVENKAIGLTAPQPFTVSVLNSKVYTSEGYLALPTNNWDTSYIVTNYYDFREVKPWAGGFVIIAKEPTSVSINLRGVGEANAETAGGREINTGVPFEITLNEGDVYVVKGDGGTRGAFDLTGTEITSDRPIGVISFHERTTMPNVLVNGNGRNHLVEMNIPTAQWDKTYASVQIDRKTAQASHGDLFRVVCSEPGTTWSMKSYDPISGAILRQDGGTLARAGAFAEISHVTAPTDLVRGFSIWSADKPIQVIQYSTSSSFDGSPIADPFQINLLPVDRYVYATVFQTPTLAQFVNHHLNLVILGDTTDVDITDHLKQITLDGTALWSNLNVVPKPLLQARIPGTNYWAISIPVTAAPHTLVSPKLPLGGYIYGYGQVDAYAWPLGPISANVVASDTMPPVSVITLESDVAWRFSVTEKRNIPAIVRPKPLRTDQVDAGIAEAGLTSGSSNLAWVSVQPPGSRRTEATEATYRVEVVDPSKPASGTSYVLDFAGNVTYSDIAYSPASPLTASMTALDFGSVRVGNTAGREITITNPGVTTQTIDAYTIATQVFTLQGITPPAPIPPGQSVAFNVNASPGTRAIISDTLRLSYNGRSLLIPLEVRGVQPVFTFPSTVDLGLTGPSAVICAEGKIEVTNTGDDSVRIADIRIVEPDAKFSLTASNCPSTPAVLKPNEALTLDCVCFASDRPGSHTATLEIVADDQMTPHTILLTASVDPALSVSEVDETATVQAAIMDDILQVQWNQEITPTRIQLTTTQGRVVLDESVPPDTQAAALSVGHLGTGTYLLRVASSTRAFIKVIQR